MTVYPTGKRWGTVAWKKTRAGCAYAKEDPRTVIEYAIAIVVALAALALAKHFFWPVVVRTARLYFSDATKAVPLIVSLVALYVAWSNYRRGNSAMAKLVDVKATFPVQRGVNRNQPYSTFEVWIKVLGIPLRNPSVVIRGRVEFGEFTAELSQFVDGKPLQRTGGALEKGMIASYGLRSFDMTGQGDKQMIIQIAEPDTENVVIAVYSNGFLAKQFRLQWKPPLRRWIRKWNNWAQHVNFKYISRTRQKWGRPIFFHREWIPTFRDPMFQLEQFANSLKREATSPPPPFAPWPPPGMQGGTMFPTSPPVPPPPPPVAE